MIEQDQIFVNGEMVTLEQFQEMCNNKKIRLKKISEGKYIKLELIYGAPIAISFS